MRGRYVTGRTDRGSAYRESSNQEIATMFRTITAKYAGICRRCNGPIAIGDKIRYGGAGRSYHFASQCPKGTGYTDDPPTSHLGNYAPDVDRLQEDRDADVTREYFGSDRY